MQTTQHLQAAVNGSGLDPRILDRGRAYIWLEHVQVYLKVRYKIYHYLQNLEVVMLPGHSEEGTLAWQAEVRFLPAK